MTTSCKAAFCLAFTFLCAGAIAQDFPPPFPRDGATKLFENDRVIVWDVAWLKQAYPVHRHVYDYAGVYYTNGDRIVVSDQGRRSPTTSVAWDTFFFRRGVTHSEEGASEAPLRAVFLEFKEDQPLGKLEATTTAPAFPGTAGKQLRDSERVMIWEFIPGPSPLAHYHTRDAVFVAFANLKPQVTFVPRGTMHSDDQRTGADRSFVFELK
jgi:hypothetical protein